MRRMCVSQLKSDRGIRTWEPDVRLTTRGCRCNIVTSFTVLDCMYRCGEGRLLGLRLRSTIKKPTFLLCDSCTLEAPSGRDGGWAESQEITNVFPSGAAFKASAATLTAMFISFCRCSTLCCHNIAATIGLRIWGSALSLAYQQSDSGRFRLVMAAP